LPRTPNEVASYELKLVKVLPKQSPPERPKDRLSKPTQVVSSGTAIVGGNRNEFFLGLMKKEQLKTRKLDFNENVAAMPESPACNHVDVSHAPAAQDTKQQLPESPDFEIAKLGLNTGVDVAFPSVPTTTSTSGSDSSPSGIVTESVHDVGDVASTKCAAGESINQSEEKAERLIHSPLADPADEERFLRDLGWVPEEEAHVPELTEEEILEVQKKVHGSPLSQQHFRTANSDNRLLDASVNLSLSVKKWQQDRFFHPLPVQLTAAAPRPYTELV